MMDIGEAARNLAVAEIEKYGLPHVIHFEISEKKAGELAEQLHADKKVVQIGIYLMDVKLGQAFQDDKVAQHVHMSADAAKEFLNKYNLDDLSQQKILNCIEAHHRDVPFVCIEAEICANADCYRFIHPKGFFLYLTILWKRKSDFLSCLLEAEKKLDEKYSILSLDLCKQELEPYYRTLKQYIADARHL